MSYESDNVSHWMIKTQEGVDKERRIIHNEIYGDIPQDIFNYEVYTPIALAPLSKYSTFIISAYYVNNKLHLVISDLRLVEGEMVNGFTFFMRGSDNQLKKLKDKLNRFCDDGRCVGINFLFRMIFNAGFKVFYAEKILKPKENSSLRAAVTIVQSANDTPDIYSQLIASIGEEDVGGNSDQ